MAEDVYTHSITIDQNTENVWPGLVTKSIIDGYYFAPISGDLKEVGQTFYYGSESQQLISGKILEMAAPTTLKHSFGFNGEDPAKTTVTYTLKPEGALTKLTVSHEGYAKNSQSFADIAGGWPIILKGLKTKLEGN